jgi:hypothetical protein
MGSEEGLAGGREVMASVDALLRSHGLEPNDLTRSLLATATEERMRERGEPLAVAVRRAIALLVASAGHRR